ncbi:MAG: OmpA family protein [Formosimonas sp.]
MKLTVKALCVALTAAATVWTGLAKAESTAQNLHWPEPKSSYLRAGQFVDPDDVRRMITNLPKREVRLLLNHPNFSEGLLGVHEWDYLFNFLTGRGEEYITCQYKVLFNDKMRVSSMHWREKQCEDLVLQKKAAPPPPPAPQAVTLNSDGLFAFGKGGYNDLQEAGRENLRRVAEELKSGFKVVRSVTITGYTDRIGSPAANMALSQVRANSVKSYLISQGIPAHVLIAQGRGADNPVVDCPGPKKPATIACLMPNRRIELTINGDK